MSLFENDEYRWRETCFVLFHEEDRPRAGEVVEALDGHGEYCTRPEESRPALERAAASGKPALVNVVIEQVREFKGGVYV